MTPLASQHASTALFAATGPHLPDFCERASAAEGWAQRDELSELSEQLTAILEAYGDEDEENERSAAPNGFDEAAMTKVMVNSDKDALYRDLDRFDSTTSPDEGEEQNNGSSHEDQGC